MPKPRSELQLICDRFRQLNIDYAEAVVVAISRLYELPVQQLKVLIARRVESMVVTPFMELGHLYRAAMLRQVAERLHVPPELARQLVENSSIPEVLTDLPAPRIGGVVSAITTQFIESILAEVSCKHGMPLEELKQQFLTPASLTTSVSSSLL